jgi:hypothetical protein
MFHPYSSIIPDTGGLGIQRDSTYSSHQRNKTINTMQPSMTFDNTNQYLYTSREDLKNHEYFDSFKGSGAKSFVSKPKSKKCKKRSRNKQMYIGMTSSYNKYATKVLKNSMHDSKV